MHAITIHDKGVCIGWGKTYTAACSCGWYGHAQLHRFSADADGFAHERLVENFVEAERMGAV